MRVDLTVHEDGQPCRDLAVVMPAAARLGDLVAADAALGAAVAAGTALWSGDRQLGPDEPLPGPALRSGAVLRVGRPGPSSPPAMSLDVVGGPDAGRSVALEPGLLAVGRAADCGLVLSDPAVSRHHAELAVTSRGVSVRDLTSTVGTTVEGVTVDRDGAALAPGEYLVIGRSTLAVSRPRGGSAADGSAPPAVVGQLPDGRGGIARSPRPHPPPGPGPVEPPEPPRAARPARVAWAAAIVPAAAGAGLAIALHSPQFLVLALLSPVVVLASAAGDRVHWRRQVRRDAVVHRRGSAAARAAIATGLAAESTRRRCAHPDPVSLAHAAAVPTTALWARSAHDTDADTVRIGLGTLPSELLVRRGDTTRPAGQVAAVPLVVDLRAGPLGVVAPRGPGLATARWLLAQLVVNRSPADLRVVLLLSEASAGAWTWTRWLPHLEAVAIGPQEHREALDRLRSRTDGPRTLVLVDAFAAEAPTPSSRQDDERVTVAVLETDPRRLPPGCATVVRTLDDATLVEVVDPSGTVVGTAVADHVTAPWAESVARSLAPLTETGGSTASEPPDSCRLRELLGDPTAEAIAQRWTHADGGAATAIGAGAGGAVVLDLVRDGPHALVAGTTGSGKSELLQSLVVGLAAAHPPDELCFVLVDYKGGAAFGACSRLPHVVGMATDLDQHLTRRALSSLDAELLRRERLFAEFGAGDLGTYRTARPAEPLARLVVVVDEFAALAEELPEFVSGLVGLAQRGRSLGLHLVLATQRPSGVVSPEIRANTAVRLSLRVTDPADSRDVVGTDAAAHLDRSRPGRAVLRRDGAVQHVQVGFLGGRTPPDRPAGVTVSPLDTWRRPRPSPAASAEPPVPTDLEVLVARLRDAATVSARRPARRPWLPPLPRTLAAAELGHSPRPTVVRIGRFDEPDRQRQGPVELDLVSGGSVLLAGAARSGRTTALLTVAGAAAERLPPRRLQLHVVDSGGGLAPLAGLPHTHSVLGRTELELVGTLLERLTEEVERRRSVIAALGRGALDELAERLDDLDNDDPIIADLAPTVLLLDGWDAVAAAADEDARRPDDRLLALLRGAGGTGLTVVIAGGRGCLTPRLTAAASTRLLLQLTDIGDYSTVGIAAGAVPSRLPPGRALRAPDGQELQFAHPGRAPEHALSVAAVAEVAARHRHADPAVRPLCVRPLPTRVTLDQVRARSGPTGRAAGFVLGVGGDDAEPVTADLVSAPARLMVAGPPRSGRTTTLLTLLRQAGDAAVTTAVAAPARSPLHAAARTAGLPVLDPSASGATVAVPRTDLLLVDDWESLADTPLADALSESLAQALRSRVSDGGPAVVLAGRTDDLLLAYRGLAAEVRRGRRAILLHPAPGDGDLVGVRLAADVGRRGGGQPPGRGLVVGDPEWGAAYAGGPVPLQVALP